MAYQTDQLQITYPNDDGTEGFWFVDRFPDVCPICGKGIKTEPLYASYTKPSDNPWHSSSERLQAVFRCPLYDCQYLFFGVYISGAGGAYLKDIGVAFVNKEITFQEPILTLSPRFAKIFVQAKTAEENKLDEIAGVGYGKALEVLIKDYLIHQNPDKAKETKEQFRLAALIQDMNDPDMQAVATRAAWLRNDETHYERTWKDKDIQDLKALIELTTQYIRRAWLTGKYTTEMPDGEHKKEKTKSEK